MHWGDVKWGLIIKLVVFVLLGAVVNVAVAWGCAWWIDTIRAPYGKDLDSPAEYRDVAVEFDRGWIDIRHYEFAGYSMYQTERISLDAGATWLDCSEAMRLAGLPHWGNPNLSPFPIDRIPELHELYGWPLYSLECECDQTGETSWSIKVAETRTTIGGYWHVPKVLPLRPIFPGFLINTLFYGVILWLLWSAPFATRRLIRKRRGQCVRCGYDLTGAGHVVCPECGD